MHEIQVIMEGLIIITGALSRKALAFNNQSKIENHQSAILGPPRRLDTKESPVVSFLHEYNDTRLRAGARGSTGAA